MDKFHAINIDWDVSDTEASKEDLPFMVDIPAEILVNEGYKTMDEAYEAASDYITNETGFCHFGFEFDEDSERELEKIFEKTKSKEIER